jgi:glutathione S-transferase
VSTNESEPCARRFVQLARGVANRQTWQAIRRPESTMLQLYGNLKSRATRCMWMLEEIGEPYQLVEKSTHPDDLQSADYLRLNPNARIPTLVDGDVVLWESMAINLYLAEKYKGAMHSPGPEALGLAAQWSFWAMLEMEHLLLDLLMQRAVLPESVRDPSYAERDELLLQKPLSVLNAALGARISERRQFFGRRPQRGQHPLLGQNGPLTPILASGGQGMAGQMPGAPRVPPCARLEKQQIG